MLGRDMEPVLSGDGLTYVLSPPLSDWEVVGSNFTAGMSRLGFFIQGRNSNDFP